MTGTTYRATHRVESPGLPPLYCLRESDALDSLERRPEGMVYILVREADGVEKWEFWRSA